MLYREMELGYRTLAKPEGLLFPVRVFDGDHFPPYAQNIQYLDCKNYVRRAEVFKSSQRYIEFQDRMIDWVPELAAAISWECGRGELVLFFSAGGIVEARFNGQRPRTRWSLEYRPEQEMKKWKRRYAQPELAAK